jgi:hypothetical protein
MHCIVFAKYVFSCNMGHKYNVLYAYLWPVLRFTKLLTMPTSVCEKNTSIIHDER